MPRNERKVGQFSGDLAVPIRTQVPSFTYVLDESHPAVQEARAKETNRVCREVWRKMDLLMDHYGVDKEGSDKWEYLVYKMAKQFVPGFRITSSSKVGAPLDWGPLELLNLYIEVESLIKNKQMTAMDACRILMRTPEGEWRYPRCRDEKTLYRRYQQSKQSKFVRSLSEEPDHVSGRILRESILETISESNLD